MDAATRRFFDHVAPLSSDSTIPAGQLWLDLHQKEASAAVPVVGGVLGGVVGAAVHYHKTKPRASDGLSDLQVETRSAQRTYEEKARHEGRDPKAGLKAKYHELRVQHADEAARHTLAASVAFGVPVGIGAGFAAQGVEQVTKPYREAGMAMFRGTRIGNLLGVK